ncbi:hypothetical protein HPB50_000948 [Hyalomma asiaticum]|uniref:Uncharacterized protein n=1 Tax=Hyalomma asiaticum TaxID=266040 RepID=A0ACB7T4T8_HYAAI|nr:hypothetical protein HPB50_000948 [Hyalomma asiaticum]
MTGRNTRKTGKDDTEDKLNEGTAKQNEIDNLRREIMSELCSLKKSVQYCSDSCDNVTAMGSDIKELIKEIKELKLSNRKLKEENAKLTVRVDELEQYSRSNNVEIKGVPVEPDVNDVVSKMGQIIGETVSKDDIDICHRVFTTKQNEPNIILRFVRREKRNSFLAKARKTRLTGTLLGYNSTKPVYVNEHLTRQNKQLLGAAVAKKREVGWRYVWTKDGRIFARRDESSAVLRLNSLSDLEKMTQSTDAS